MSLVVPFDEIFANKTGLLANHASWERVEIGAVCEIQNGFAFKSSLFSKGKGFPVVRIRDLSKGSTETFYVGDFPSDYIVGNGDLLIGMDGIFRCWEWQGGKAGLNQRVCKIIAKGKFVDRKFIFYGLNGYLKAIEDATSSVTVGHLSSLDVLRIPFPLPPLNEQRRIVAKLEELLARVEAGQQRLAKIPVILKRFRQSVLAAACSGRLTADWRERQGLSEGDELPEGWNLSQVYEVSESLKYGTSQKCSYKKIGVPVLRIPNIKEWGINHNDLKYADLPAKEYQTLRLAPGDILVIRSNGSVSLVGKSALVQEAESDFAYAGYLIRIRPDREKVLPEYLNLALASYETRLQIEIPARSTSGVNNINSDELRALSFNLSPIPEQHEIVRRVEALFALADQIETSYQKAKTHVDRLTQSILAKAFRGELVPQDENDEPAAVLLERIRAERAKVEPKKPHRKAPARPTRKTYPTESELPLAKAAEPAATYDDDSIPQQILAVMQPGREYSRADLAVPLKLSTALWNHGIRQLKDQGQVSQQGEKRGARYRLA